MRYRVLSPTRDYVFGRGPGEFLVNTPETVAQAVLTRLLLITGEWFLDLEEGTPYLTDILGTGTQNIYDQAIQERILSTQGVTGIQNYVSFLDPETRRLTVSCTIITLYGNAEVTIAPQNPFPPATGRLNIDFILDQSILG